jgi:hypothetical protein
MWFFTFGKAGQIRSLECTLFFDNSVKGIPYITNSIKALPEGGFPKESLPAYINYCLLNNKCFILDFISICQL